MIEIIEQGDSLMIKNILQVVGKFPVKPIQSIRIIKYYSIIEIGKKNCFNSAFHYHYYVSHILLGNSGSLCFLLNN